MLFCTRRWPWPKFWSQTWHCLAHLQSSLWSLESLLAAQFLISAARMHSKLLRDLLSGPLSFTQTLVALWLAVVQLLFAALASDLPTY